MSEYPGILRRFLAASIDGLLITGLVPLDIAILAMSNKGPYMVWLWFDAFLGVAYFVTCHALWGQTLGKRVTGLRVQLLNGRPLSWREAALRNVAELLGAFAVAIFGTVALASFDWSALSGLEWGPKYNKVSSALQPPMWTLWLSGAWYLAEIGALLTNPRRRAVHDFIAGTVVVWRKKH